MMTWGTLSFCSGISIHSRCLAFDELPFHPFFVKKWQKKGSALNPVVQIVPQRLSLEGAFVPSFQGDDIVADTPMLPSSSSYPYLKSAQGEGQSEETIFFDNHLDVS